jgi:hypothetical protein
MLAKPFTDDGQLTSRSKVLDFKEKGKRIIDE